MPYDKYIKIHNPKNAKNSNSGIQDVNRYDDNDEKTMQIFKEQRDKLENNRAQESIDFLNRYAENEMKTINPEGLDRLVSVLNAKSRESFVDDCIAAEKLYHSHKTEKLNEGACAVEAYHIISSCKGTDIDPVLVHKTGCDLAKALAGNDFAAKVCTHLNTDNYHNHIIINAYAIDGSKKFKDEFHLYKKIRTISNEIALRYGFEIIMEGQTNKKNWSEYLDGKAGWTIEKSKHNSFKKDIRECIKIAQSYRDFEIEMESLGYMLTHAGDRTVYAKDNYVVSDFSLGSRYSQESIEGEIEKKAKKEIQKRLAKQTASAAKNYVRIETLETAYISPYDEYGVRRPFLVRFLLLIKKYIKILQDKYFSEAAREAFPDNIRVQSASQKLQSIDRILTILDKYDINTLAGLDGTMKAAGMDAAIADHKANALFETADRMEEIVQLLNMENQLSEYIHKLGITDEQFRISAYTEDEIHAAYASLDPVTGDQKRRLFNVLNDSDFRIATGSFSSLSRSEADKILGFLNGKIVSRPEKLVTKDEYIKLTAEKAILKKATERAQKMRKKYHAAPVTLKQKQALQASGYAGDLNAIHKDKAMYLLNYLSENPLKNMSALEKISKEITVKRPCSDWQRKTLKQLKALHPESFKTIDPSQFYYDLADKTISYYLSQYDVKEIYDGKEKKKKPKKIDFDSYEKETQAALVQYRKLLDYKAKYDLKDDNREAFLEKYESILKDASAYSKQSMVCNSKYKDLSEASRLFKNCATKSFVYGVLYGGEDTALRAAKDRYKNDKIGRLKELSELLSIEINRLLSFDISNFQSVSSVRFEPIDQRSYELLQELAELDPTIVNNDIPQSIRYYNVPDAIEALLHVQRSRLLEKLMQEEKEKESSEERKEELAKKIETDQEEAKENQQEGQRSLARNIR